MMLFLQFAGFPTGLDPLFNFMGLGFNSNPQLGLNNTNITISSFWDYVFNPIKDAFSGWGLLWGLGVSSAIIAGLTYSGRLDIAIFAGFASAVLFAFIPTLFFSVRYALDNNFPVWAISFLAIIFIPLTIGFILALVEYIRGTD